MIDPQDRAIKVLVGLIKSHQAILAVLRYNMSPDTPVVNLREADAVVYAASKLLNELRLGEVKVANWIPVTVLWCVECGHNWEGEIDGEDCPECGGQCSDA